MHVSQKNHNFAAEYRVNQLLNCRLNSARYVSVACMDARKRRSISVHNNINKFNYNQNDETESIEKMYDSRRVPKAAGRGGAW